MGGAESAQSPGSHTLSWSHGDLACVASPTYFMGLRSPERAASSASFMRLVGGAPASTLRVTVTPGLSLSAWSISALATARWRCDVCLYSPCLCSQVPLRGGVVDGEDQVALAGTVLGYATKALRGGGLVRDSPCLPCGDFITPAATRDTARARGPRRGYTASGARQRTVQVGHTLFGRCDRSKK